MTADTDDAPALVLRSAGLAAGAILTLIGLRFLAMPAAAQQFFGLEQVYPHTELHAVVGLRDVWLGLIAVAAAWTRDWRSLGIWLSLATMVCFADCALVRSAEGPLLAVAFHAVSGLVCLALTLLAVRVCRRQT